MDPSATDIDPVYPTGSPGERRLRFEARIGPDGAVTIPASLITPVMAQVLGWWRDHPPRGRVEKGRTQRPLRAEPPSNAVLMTMEDFAATIGFGKRKVEQFVAEGMPTVGDFRSRRVLVTDAHAWVIRRLQENGDGLVERARLDARKRRVE